ncbi:MAG: repair protein RecO protein [Parcubacteria group bacterium GW2011_GWC1_38_22]|nr:MAG: repair protein RecO protein [Parcubacteria group bacterium GW2011_GWC1_38_22]
MEYKYTGIILNKWDVGETDRIYSIYTLEGGKIRSLAKGVRKSHAKLASSLENITLADITIVRARGLGKITGSIVEQNFSALKQDCDALLETFLSLSIFDKIVDFDSSDKDVFELLKNYLTAVDQLAQSEGSEKYLMLRLGFMIKLLDALGYSIEVSSCVICQSSLDENALNFNSEHGGTLCASCGKENLGGSLPIKANAIKMMRLFLKNDIRAHVKVRSTLEDCDSVRLVVDDFLRWNTGINI